LPAARDDTIDEIFIFQGNMVRLFTSACSCAHRIGITLLAAAGLGLASCGDGSGSRHTTGSDNRYLVALVEFRDSSAGPGQLQQFQMIDPRTGLARTISRVAAMTTIHSGQPGADGSTTQISPHHLLYVQDGALHKISLVLADTEPQPITLVPGGMCRTSSLRSAYADPDQPEILTINSGSDAQCGTDDDGVKLLKIHHNGRMETIAESIGKSFFILGGELPDTPFSWATTSSTTIAATVLERLDSNRPGVFPIDFTVLPDGPFQVIGGTRDLLVLQGQQHLWLLNPAARTPATALRRLDPHAAAQAGTQAWYVLGRRADVIFLMHQSYGDTLADYSWRIHALQIADGSSRQIAAGPGFVAPQVGTTAILLNRTDTTGSRMELIGFDGQLGPTLLSASDAVLSTRWLDDDKVLVDQSNPGTTTIRVYDKTGKQLFQEMNATSQGLRLTNDALIPDQFVHESQILYLTDLTPADLGHPGYGTDLWLFDLTNGQKWHLGQLPDRASFGNKIVFVFAQGTAGAYGLLSILGQTSTLDPITQTSSSRLETRANYIFDTRRPDSLRLVQTR
jgi:hypothetical protein